MITLFGSSEDEKRLRSLAVHEAGHAIVAAAFNLNPRTAIGGIGSGACLHEKGTDFQEAAVSWAGVIAEDLFAARNYSRVLPSITLTRATFRDWLYAFLYAGGIEEFSHVSQSDVDGIKSYPDRYETAEAAFLILANRRDTLEWKAERLADASRDIYRASQIRNDFQYDKQNLLFSLR